MPKKIGMVSGGQLGRMLTDAAIDLGFEVGVVDPTPDCPAHQAGAKQITASYKDKGALLELAAESDFFTIEIEHIDTAVLEEISRSIPVNPAPSAIRMIQNKYEQKKFLKEKGFPTAEFIEINSHEDAERALKLWGGKLILKSKLDAYDGRGNEVITDKSQIAGAIERFSGGGVYAEKIVDFQKELAVMSAKDIEGNISSYPVVETVHKRNICVEVYAPADISPAIAHSARETASRVVKELEGAGVYGVEMFLDKEENVFINEIAPRVHNSGHYTMDMCEPSQFKQHILAVTGQELETPVMKAPFCCMVNILGERDGPVEMKGVEEAEKIPGVSVYIYGKKPTKIDRKMGHINAIGDTMETAKNKAMQARKLISI